MLTLILLYAHTVLNQMCVFYFGFVEELSEAASRVLLRVGGHLQDKLHDHSLVRHLLHQCFFLKDAEQTNKRFLSTCVSQQVACFTS